LPLGVGLRAGVSDKGFSPLTSPPFRERVGGKLF